VAQTGENEWETNFKLPPGLTPGWHDVRIGVGKSRPGSARRIAVDVPLAADDLRIMGVSDGTTWERSQLDLSRGDALALWVSGLPENVDCNNLFVGLDGGRLTVTYIEAPRDGARQVNVKMPGDLPVGPCVISVSVGHSRAIGADLVIAR
jgi:hypothetical protein